MNITEHNIAEHNMTDHTNPSKVPKEGHQGDVVELLRQLIGEVAALRERVEAVEKGVVRPVVEQVEAAGDVGEKKDVAAVVGVGEGVKLELAGNGGRVDGASVISSAASVSTEVSVKEMSVSGSWSDEVERECEASGSSKSTGARSVEMPREVRSLPVTFGGIEGEDSSEVSDASGLFRQYVRNERVKGLRGWLQRNANVLLPRAAFRELAIATYAAGAMPAFFERGKDNLKMLAVVGDAALTLAAARRAYALGRTAESAQAVRSKELSDVFLRQRLVKAGLGKFLLMPAGVDLAVSKAGATAVEAIAGVVDLHCERDAVLRFALSIGVLK